VQDELEETIPGVMVTVFDAAGKGCKYLISDMNRLNDQVRGHNGRWRKPAGAEWYIFGRDKAKYLPARSALGNKRVGFGRHALESGSSRRFFVEVDGDDGETKRIVARRWVCPSCGKPIVDKNGALNKVPDQSKLLTCDGNFCPAILEPDRRECGLDRSPCRKQLAEIPAGRILEEKGKRWRVCEFKEPPAQSVVRSSAERHLGRMH
jgi:hypothetical protein